MNLQQLRYARALAETMSFNAAAERCHVTQPTLSNGIAQLERDLGSALFARTTRSVQLTEFGRELLPDLIDVLNAQASLIARARHLVQPDRPLIRIGVSPLIGVAMVDVLTQPYRRDNPMTEVVFRELNLAEMTRMLESGQLDFVFGPVDLDAPVAASLRSVALHDEELVFVAKGDAVGPREVVLEDLAPAIFVMVPDDCGLAKTTRALFQRNGLALREYPGQAMSYRVLQDWAQIGIGAAILPQSKVKPGTGARILGSLGQSDGLRIHYQALWQPGDGHETAKVARFLTEVAPAILAGLA